MYITVTTSNDMSFGDIYRNAWNGAVDTLNTVLDESKEKESMELLNTVYPDGVDGIESNDFLTFEDDYIFNGLGIDLEEGEEE